MSYESSSDPRDVLARDKFFTLRPRPLEQWLWRAGVCASAERVFWLHWQEGMRQNWCSAIPLKRVASLCSLDVSTVTRAYQVLGRLGLIRRQDPGRDPTRPFEQAVAITEVRVPRELLQELNRHPNRARRDGRSADRAPDLAPAASTEGPEKVIEEGVAFDPYRGLGGRERMRRLATLLECMSPAERQRYEEALCSHQAVVAFDASTRLSAEQRATVLQILANLAAKPAVSRCERASANATLKPQDSPRLSALQLAQLRRQVQTSAPGAHAGELLRQVVWSIEHGALRRFTPLHAMRIALKKIRMSQWSRPHRMPPNWLGALAGFAGAGRSALTEPCGMA